MGAPLTGRVVARITTADSLVVVTARDATHPASLEMWPAGRSLHLVASLDDGQVDELIAGLMEAMRA